ncbi:MAG: glycosyltransferase family 4 protein [Bacteroidales bacterium]|nr:glycosyltransferase family 4 protein [Bacteroidales bacterium]
MKIAFIGGRDIKRIGGIETYMYHLCTELKRRGHEPIMYCESDHDGEEWVNGFQVIHQKSPRSKLITKPLLGLRAIRRVLREHPDIDVYHFNAFGSGLFGWWARMKGKTTILQLHGIESRRTKWGMLARSIIRIVEPLVVKCSARHCTSVSLEQVNIINCFFPGKRCVYIPTAVNLIEEEIHTPILEKYHLETKRYFLYLGRLVQDKNPDYLIKAYNESGIKDYKLVIAGDNEADPNYFNHLHELAADNENVIFTGAVYGDDKECLLQNCYSLCLPSTIEGLSISLLEAMSYGRPVIASDIQANREGLGDNALWVEPEDVDTLSAQLLYSLSHKDEMEKMGEKNLTRVKEHFTWPIVVDKYLAFVNNCVRKSSRKAHQ